MRSLAWRSGVVVVALTAASVARPAAAQNPAPDTGRETAAAGAVPVPEVRIDAVVTDRNGRPILDLKPGDFELVENGVTLKLGGVELRTPPRPAGLGAPPVTGGPAGEGAREAGARVFAFFLDEFHVAAGAESATVRDAVTRFVDERLRPGDLAAVLKPLDAVTTVELTRDRDRLRSAIASFEGRRGDDTPRSAFESEYIGHAPAAIAAARAQIVTASLRELTMRLGELRADRAAIVLVSGGFPREAGGRQLRVSDLQGLIRAASRFHQVVYAFDPTAAPAPPAGPAPRQDAVTPETATLQWLAAQTGGEAVRGAAMAAGLRRMSDDLDSYYVLTYQPMQLDGRFHPVEIRTKRRDLQVKARPGYWSPLASDWMAGLLTPTSSVPRRALHRSPYIDAWTGVTRTADGRLHVVVTWTPKTQSAIRLPLMGPPPKTPPGPVMPPQKVQLKARTAKGADVFEGQLGSVGSGGALAERAEFDAPVGRIELDLTIVAADGTTLDVDTRDVDVPDSKAAAKGPILLPAAIVRARTAREWREFTVNPNAPPTPDRNFVRGDHLLIRVAAMDGSGAAVPVVSRILNPLAQPIRTLDPAEPPEIGGAQQFDLPLAWLAPGEYLLEFSTKNDAGQVTDRVTIQIR
jgi:VWFA-related protein